MIKKKCSLDATEGIALDLVVGTILAPHQKNTSVLSGQVLPNQTHQLNYGEVCPVCLSPVLGQLGTKKGWPSGTI